MKLFRFASFVVLAGLVAVPVAEAKRDKSSESTEETSSEATAAPTIEATGIAAFDDVFNKVAEIHKTLDGAAAQLAEANNSIATALGLAAGTPLADALADLKSKANGKIEVAMNGTVPELKASDAVPENVSTAITAVNTAVTNVSGTVASLATLPDQVKALVDEAKALPAKLNPTLLTESGLKATDLGKVGKTLKNNVSATTKTPERVTAVTSELVGFVDTIKNFATAGGGEAAPQ